MKKQERIPHTQEAKKKKKKKKNPTEKGVPEGPKLL